MSETPTRYEIRTVRDFLNVPEDRLSECLREFAIMLEMARAATGLLDAVSDEVAEPGAIRWRLVDRFVWIDDGERNMTFNVLTTPVVEPAVP